MPRQEAEYFRTWMTRILINKCIDIIRKNKREHPVSDFPEYGEGFKISEIAQLLDMEENTVKTRLSRGRSKFKEIWTGQEAVHQN